jgi:hypothetical protein
VFGDECIAQCIAVRSWQPDPRKVIGEWTQARRTSLVKSLSHGLEL